MEKTVVITSLDLINGGVLNKIKAEGKVWATPIEDDQVLGNFSSFCDFKNWSGTFEVNLARYLSLKSFKSFSCL